MLKEDTIAAAAKRPSLTGSGIMPGMAGSVQCICCGAKPVAGLSCGSSLPLGLSIPSASAQKKGEHIKMKLLCNAYSLMPSLGIVACFPEEPPLAENTPSLSDLKGVETMFV